MCALIVFKYLKGNTMNRQLSTFKLTFFTSLFTILLLAGCEKDETVYTEFHITVSGQGIDCGDLYLIDFHDNLEELYQITGNESWQRCYAYDLDEVFKVQGKELIVKIRKSSEDELFACTTLGPGYPWVKIISAEEVTTK